MALTIEIFNEVFLYPAELHRGIVEGWKPSYSVLVDGSCWLDAHDWLVENMSGLWMDHIRQPEYLIGFELAEDAVAFKLRWL